jgi:hypothetical protein
VDKLIDLSCRLSDVHIDIVGYDKLPGIETLPKFNSARILIDREYQDVLVAQMLRLVRWHCIASVERPPLKAANAGLACRSLSRMPIPTWTVWIVISY